MSGKVERPIEEKKDDAAALPSVSPVIESRSRKTCVACGLKPTISDGCPYCASCMNRRSREAQKGKNAPVSTRLKRPKEDKAPTEKTPTIENMEVNIDFGMHTHILKQVQELADNEIRPLDLQIIYLLKHHFDAPRAALTEVKRK